MSSGYAWRSRKRIQTVPSITIRCECGLTVTCRAPCGTTLLVTCACGRVNQGQVPSERAAAADLLCDKTRQDAE